MFKVDLKKCFHLRHNFLPLLKLYALKFLLEIFFKFRPNYLVKVTILSSPSIVFYNQLYKIVKFHLY